MASWEAQWWNPLHLPSFRCQPILSSSVPLHFLPKGGVICISEVIDISPGNLDSSLCFFQPSVSHDVLSTSLVAQMFKRLSTMWETWVRSLGQEDPLEKEMSIHSSTIAWKIPWIEEPGRLQPMGSQRVGHDWATLTYLTLPYLTLHIS